ncbi:MAG: flavodoxin family protein [Oscillospiraceae bacterium]|jgi:NAD(P)H-dependent FMN reductase|nr:flavodoxin family protein [Oscillospiraceae bacterium]
MGKNVILINGSPRNGGNSDAVIDLVKRQLEQNGASVEVYRVREHTVAPCVGCDNCKNDDEVCIHKDGAAELIERLYKADSVLLIAPLYYTSVPGTVKVLFDRFYARYNFKKGLKTPSPMRKAGVVFCYGGSPADVLHRAAEYVAYCFRDLGYGSFDAVLCPMCTDKTTFSRIDKYQSNVAALTDWLISGNTDNISGASFGIERDRFAEGSEPPAIAAARQSENSQPTL